MENKIDFSNASFGKKYITRCGYEALYIDRDESALYFIVEGQLLIDEYSLDGRFSDSLQIDHPFDIVKEAGSTETKQ